MMLISRDSSLAQSCQGIVERFPDLRLLLLARADQADAYLGREEIKLVLVHVVDDQGTSDTIRLLRQLASLERAMALLVISEQHDALQAWSLTRLGAVDYLSRPVALRRLDALIHAFGVGTCRADGTDGGGAALADPPSLPGERARVAKFPPRIEDTASHGMEALLEQVRLVATQDTTILLGGETGTGKTRLAHLIHELSPRRAEPFVAINCGALAADLIESEMFGHVKGAFTGADRTRAGKFAAADRGTLLLDEVDALPLVLQAKLLRAVEERVFEPVGSNESMPVRARLIAASNRPLEREVEAGRFRADLYYRLNVIGFSLPPLREQPGMIRQLAASFLEDCAARNDRSVHGISAAALCLLEDYRWPGNIRELRNVIERAVALCSGPSIEVEDLPDTLRSAVPSSLPRARQSEPSEGLTAPSILRHARGQAESVLIMQALRKHGNNRLRAALELGISRRTLYKKLHRYGLMEMGPTRTDRRVTTPRILQGYTNPGKAV
jgi:two-component system response regulator HydG